MFFGMSARQTTLVMNCLGAECRRFESGGIMVFDTDSAVTAVSGRAAVAGARIVERGQIFFACAGDVALAAPASEFVLLPRERLCRCCANACAAHSMLLGNLLFTRSGGAVGGDDLLRGVSAANSVSDNTVTVSQLCVYLGAESETVEKALCALRERGDKKEISNN